MTNAIFRVCNGKKYKRSYFHTMREVDFRIFMVKLCQGRREETCEPFFVGLMDVFQAPRRLRALHGPNFATLSLSRGRVRMNHNRMGTSSRGMSHAHFACTEKGTSLYATPLGFYKRLIFVRLHALNGAVCVVRNLSVHDTTLMVYTAG